MKFEYRLNYDLVKGAVDFEITSMPEELRDTGDTRVIEYAGHTWQIKSYYHPELRMYNRHIYLRGIDRHKDNLICREEMSLEQAMALNHVLMMFQRDVECMSDEVLMTISEIEEKLGIKNLKIRKEDN